MLLFYEAAEPRPQVVSGTPSDRLNRLRFLPNEFAKVLDVIAHGYPSLFDGGPEPRFSR